MVHGRLTLGNGTPGFRIWPVGTKRMLGVLDGNGEDETDNVIPSKVRKLAFAPGGLEIPVFGDYEVCPLTTERQGWMQMVCIKSASNLLRATSN